jgi:hypothetical protein
MDGQQRLQAGVLEEHNDTIYLSCFCKHIAWTERNSCLAYLAIRRDDRELAIKSMPDTLICITS